MISAARNTTGARVRTLPPSAPPGGDYVRDDQMSRDVHADPPAGQRRAAEAAARQIASALVEVLSGDRGASQLNRMVTPAVLAQVRFAIAAPRPGSTRLRHRIQTIHMSHPANGVVEVCAVLGNSARASALALRLELLDGRWRCTAVETDQQRRRHLMRRPA